MVVTPLSGIAPLSGPDRLEALVTMLAGMQTDGTPRYPDGLFPSQRFYPYLPFAREDDGIFLTAQITLLLRDRQPHLPSRVHAHIDAMHGRTRAIIPLYRHRDGTPIYNFWRTQKGARGHWPNSLIFSRLDALKAPPDADDSALVHLAFSHSADETAHLKQRLAQHANGQRGLQVKSSLLQYRDLPAYTTWFGSPKVLLEFDVCVMANVMLFVFRNGLSLNEHDDATLTFIERVIAADHHLRHPGLVSPWYPTAPAICYYVSRMLAAGDLPRLQACRKKLLADMRGLLPRATNYFDYVRLASSLHRLGEPAPECPFPLPDERLLHRYPWFVIQLLYQLDHLAAKRLSNHPAAQVHYRCPAYGIAHVLEYECLRATFR